MKPPACKRDLALLAGVLGLTLAVHAPAFGAAFARDDQLLLFDAVNVPLVEYLFDMHGGHLMPVHKVIFVVLHRLFGYSAAPFFTLELATHLLNVGLLFRCLRKLVTASLAAFGAALWGAAIVHHSSLCWFSVYGQVLAVTCLLLVLLDLIRVGRHRAPPTRAALLRWNLALIIGGASFGVGIALSVVAPLAALAFVARSQRRRVFLGLLPATLAVPALYAVTFANTGGDRGPLTNDFFLPAALKLLVYLPAVGLASLAGGPAATKSSATVFWGPLASRPLEQAFPTLLALGVALTLMIALGYRVATRPIRHRMIGAALLSIAVYTLVAFGRTQMIWFMSFEQIATEHRYHYASLLGAAMLLALALAALGRWVARRQWLGRIPILASSFLLAWLGLQVIPSISLAGASQAPTIAQAKRALRETLAEMEAVIRSAPSERDVYILNSDYAPTRDLFGVRSNPERFPGAAALFAVTHDNDIVQGRRVHFVETRANVLDKIRSKPDRRMARLLISSAEAQALGVRVDQLSSANDPRR